MLYFFLSLTVLVIISQTVHTYSVFDSISKIENKKLKRFQAVVFCSILSLSILAFVMNGNEKLAFAGAVVEVVINMYYYAEEFWKNGFKSYSVDVREKRSADITRFWRKNWIKIFFGVILPVLIYIFAEQITLLV